jgi:hypothetical protein
VTAGGGSGEHRIGLVPCPLCKNITAKRIDCKACNKEGMIPVDQAIAIGVSVSDTEREMAAVHPTSVVPPTDRDPDTSE